MTPALRSSTRPPALFLAFFILVALHSVPRPARAQNVPSSPEVHLDEADVRLDIENVIIDAPWRVWLRPGRPAKVPVLFFFPDTNKKFRTIRVTRLALHDESQAGPGGSLLFEHALGHEPQVFAAPGGLTGEGLTLTDAWGRSTDDLHVVSPTDPPAGPHASWQVARIDDTNRGWHVILELPVPAGRTGSLEISGEVDYRRLSEPDPKVYTMRRRLSVALDPDPLPTFEGWHAYDVHLHTIAEFKSDTSVLALRKNYGGPMRMIAETATALGLVDSPAAIKDALIVTDHNCYYSDTDFPRWGPTVDGLLDTPVHTLHPEYAPYFVNREGKVVAQGQREAENYQEMLGGTAGEELSLAKKPGGVLNPIGALAAHMLIYSTRHFMGPFHGGGFILWPKEANDNAVDRVLADMATDGNFPQGFAYAAHPFTRSDLEKKIDTRWNDEQLALAAYGDFIRRRDGQELEFVFKGYELFNERKTRIVTASIGNPAWPRRLLEDPSILPAWSKGDPLWDDNLQFSLAQWHALMARGLHFELPGRPDTVCVRKLYIAGGSDAHADFNRASDIAGRGFFALPSLLSKLFKFFEVSDNALGKVRTVVDPSAIDPSEAPTQSQRELRAYARGQDVVTDGPVVDARLDADGHLDSAQLIWHERPRYEDDDGQIGGGGRMDGARSALLAVGSAAPMLRFRMQGSPAFGGIPTRIEVYRDTEDAPSPLVTVQRDGVKASVLAPAGCIDPAAVPVLPDRDRPAVRGPAGDGDSAGASAGARGGAGGGAGGGAPVAGLAGDVWRALPLDAIGPSGIDPRPGATWASLSSPAILSLGAFTAHASLPPFDFRCYTNPIWLLPVKALPALSATPGGAGRETGRAADRGVDRGTGVGDGAGTAVAGAVAGTVADRSPGDAIAPAGLSVTLRFPISMGGEAPRCWLAPLAGGIARVDARAIAMRPAQDDTIWARNPRAGIENAQLTLTNRDASIPITGGGEYILIVDRPTDRFGNSLNALAFRMDVAALLASQARDRERPMARPRDLELAPAGARSPAGGQ